ncbi:MAG: anthrone oxygenase family protein, partial [Candidatus Limnocylindrales bacterium]
PRNEALDRVEPSSPDAAGRWSRYLREWTTWNHVRGVAALAAAALLTIALHVR